MNHNFFPAIAWILLTAACFIIILIALKTVLKKTGWATTVQSKILNGTAAAILFWLVALGVSAKKGFFADFSKLPPRPAFAILLPLPVVLIICFSKKGSALLKLVPAQWLVFIQSFRIVVELFLLMAFIGNKLPVQMTFEGRNFDILAGILALPVGYMLLKKIKQSGVLILAFNIIGLLLLLNVLTIAMLSLPTSIRYFMNEPSVTLIAQFPFIFLPGFLVPLAYMMHIFSLRKLTLDKRSVQLIA